MTKLEERMKQYNIPKRPGLMQGKKVCLFRIPLVTRTAGGLFLPEDAAEPNPMAVLIGAGLKALDIMRDALWELGDIVWLPRHTTWSPEVERKDQEAGKHVVFLNIEDLVCSVDADERLAAEYDVDWNETVGEHKYVPRGTAIGQSGSELTRPGVIIDQNKKTKRRAA